MAFPKCIQSTLRIILLHGRCTRVKSFRAYNSFNEVNWSFQLRLSSKSMFPAAQSRVHQLICLVGEKAPISHFTPSISILLYRLSKSQRLIGKESAQIVCISFYVLFKTWLIRIQIRYDFWSMNLDIVSGVDGVIGGVAMNWGTTMMLWFSNHLSQSGMNRENLVFVNTEREICK